MNAEHPLATPRVRWLGHATALIELGGARLLTDPLLRPSFLPFVRRRAEVGCLARENIADVDAVLISHAHQDHLDLPSLRLLPAGTRLLVPRGVGSWLARRGFRHLEEIAAGEDLSVGEVSVRATAAAHQGSRLPFGPRAPALGYVLAAASTIYFAGDTDIFEEMRDIPTLAGGRIDLALLPVGGWGPTLRGGHMDPLRAARSLSLLRPRQAVPIHWGTFWPLGCARIRPARFHLPGERFRAAARRLAPGVHVRVLRPGGSVRIGVAEHEGGVVGLPPRHGTQPSDR